MPSRPKMPAANPPISPSSISGGGWGGGQGEPRFAPTEPASYLVNVELDDTYRASGLPGSTGLAGDADYFANAVRYVLAAEGATPPLEVGLRIVDDAAIQQLHRQFFGLDTPTDVIAFGQQEQDLAATAQPFATARDEPPGPLYWQHEDVQIAGRTTVRPYETTASLYQQEETSYLGDIVASFETAAAQASDYDHTALEELTELVMHGTLHLLGYDDHDPAGYHLMHSHEDAYVAAFLAAESKGQANA